MEFLKYLELIGGLVLLVFSGDYLVKGGVAVAQRLKISSLVIGMTVVAFGTSAPELLVSMQAAFSGSPEIALGNVIGSNIANIALILGLTALILPIAVNRDSVRQDWPMMMLASVLFFLAAMDGTINRLEGAFGFILLVVFVLYSVIRSRRQVLNQEAVSEKPMNLWLALGLIIVSCVGLSYGAKFFVQGASQIAIALGVSERVIGVTIVAFGTSVPELAASVAAAVKKEMDISIGNIIGSNIFNILCVIGLTSVIKPIPVDFAAFSFDMIVMLLVAVLLFLFMLPWKNSFKQIRNGQFSLSELVSNGTLGRVSALILILVYVVYICQLF